MNKLGVRNIILVSLSAALLNLSFVLAQPAQPPANGALTPNFTGLNVSGASNIGTLNVTGTSDLSDLNVTGNIEISDTLETNNIRSIDGTLTNFDDNVNMDGDLSVGADISASYLNLRSVSTGLNTVGDIQVGGALKTNTINSNNNSGNPIRVNSDLYLDSRLQVNSDSFLRNTNINGTLNVNTIEERTNNYGTRFNNDIIVSGAVNGQSVGAATGSFGTLEVGGNSLMQFIGSKLYARSGVASTNSWRSVSCLSGDVLINCGAYSTSNNSIKRIYTYGSSGVDTTCAVTFSGTGSGQMADAICLDL